MVCRKFCEYLQSVHFRGVVIHFNFACGCCQRVLSHFSLLLSFSLWVLSFSPLLLSLPTSLLPRCRRWMCIKKEPPESPLSPKALDFKPFCRSDNSISLYQFLGLHFKLMTGSESLYPNWNVRYCHKLLFSSVLQFFAWLIIARVISICERIVIVIVGLFI